MDHRISPFGGLYGFNRYRFASIPFGGAEVEKDGHSVRLSLNTTGNGKLKDFG